MDREAWYSVTPEDIARNEAIRVYLHSIFTEKNKCLDCFCCVGGDSIQHATQNFSVTAVDIDKMKLEMLKHNAEIYEVEKSINCVCEDAFEFVEEMNTREYDVIIISPPWGGPGAFRNKQSLNSLFPGLKNLFCECVEKCTNVILHVPRQMEPENITREFNFPIEVVTYALGERDVMQSFITGALIIP
ncbi:trimethylguanosine synthase, putative [Entamoeba invadens IP1]|uniref:Trimethylguanosine synthase n=1 Tax=Entamoeba invadens IP1 TaxID=370355 RepID=L7FMM4_ENTIV|nr:trimethylguanosine synthase, putative [Entamoeba invadens IP1]ELP89671.1 trimethylguanosine synthase, putative [Entamoeba invadens IP1]|eukprot:XP_004256442.1 trimethylguanosine synthase, putative [Entamoeba invadens IP1]